MTAFFLIFPFAAFTSDEPYDYVIKDALVFDGESLLPMKRDIALLGDQMVQIGEIARADGREVIEAEGLVAAPGFIDIHTHSDFNPFVYPDLANKVLQGVTTEVIGNCGMSAAPAEGSHKDEIAGVWRREGVEIPSEISWTSLEEYRGDLEFQGMDTNFVGLVGHGNLRSAVIGMGEKVAGPEETAKMKEKLNEAFDEGAAGISFGLTYLPGIFASQDEIAALCEEAARRSKLCVFHIRNEGKNLVESIEEAVEIARRTNVHVHISHLKAAGQKNWPKIEEVFQKIESAQAEGLQITADAYPYTAGFAELGVILPDEIYQDPNRVARLQETSRRSTGSHPAENEKGRVAAGGTPTGSLLKELEEYYTAHPVSWDSIKVATVTKPENSKWQGKSILEISQALGKSPVETLTGLLADEKFKVSAFYFSQSEEVIQKILSKDYVAVGSDSIADASASPHPRAFGTFARVLSSCVTDQNIAANPCWGRVIHQMTGLPARILGLENRGKIGTGVYADLVLFDPLAIKDRATYENPKAAPEGIRWVFINGIPAVREGKYEPVHSGVFLVREK